MRVDLPTRVAAQQHHGTLDHRASQGAVELLDAGDPAHLRGRNQAKQGQGLAAPGRQLTRPKATGAISSSAMELQAPHSGQRPSHLVAW